MQIISLTKHPEEKSYVTLPTNKSKGAKKLSLSKFNNIQPPWADPQPSSPFDNKLKVRRLGTILEESYARHITMGDILGSTEVKDHGNIAESFLEEERMEDTD